MRQSCGFCEDFPAKVQAMLDSMVRNGVCAGASIAVGRFGKQVVRCDSGWENTETQEPISDQTLFQMYSLTKPVTAVAIMQLYEKGCFQLTDPVSKYLPARSSIFLWLRCSYHDRSQKPFTGRGMGLGRNHGDMDVH